MPVNTILLLASVVLVAGSFVVLVKVEPSPARTDGRSRCSGGGSRVDGHLVVVVSTLHGQ